MNMNMNFEFTSLNTQYNPEMISAIAKENNNSAKSNVSSVYDSKSMNLDAAVLSISSVGSARISAMMSKSIQLRASASNPSLSPADRQAVNNQLKEIRREMDTLQNKTSTDTSTSSTNAQNSAAKVLSEIDNETEADIEETEVSIDENIENILKNAKESLITQNANRDHVMQLI